MILVHSNTKGNIIPQRTHTGYVIDATVTFNNIRDVSFKNDIDLHSLHTVSIGEMNNKIIIKWTESVSDEDK